jgi:putative endonuclease
VAHCPVLKVSKSVLNHKGKPGRLKVSLFLHLFLSYNIPELDQRTTDNGQQTIFMKNRRQKCGEQGEALAVRRLKKAGYKIIETNYRTRLGEIDIIAKDKDTIVFVEVKSRRSVHFGNPKQAVTLQKQKKISMVALCYLKATGQSTAKARFDVVTIISNQDKPQVEIIKNAFELAYA